MCIWVPRHASAKLVAQIAASKYLSQLGWPSDCSNESSMSMWNWHEDQRPRPSTAPSMPSIKNLALKDEEVDEQEQEYYHEDEEVSKRSHEVLQPHRHHTPIHRAGKRGRSPSHSPPPKQFRMGRRRRQRSKANLDDNINLCQVDVRHLRYSQESCGRFFQCGRSVAQLVKALWDGDVSLSAPFLQLSVFETRDKRTHEPVLSCIDNRRLLALKEYATLLHEDEPVMVNVNLFRNATVMEVKRFLRNSDNTEGRDVRVRGSGKQTLASGKRRRRS